MPECPQMVFALDVQPTHRRCADLTPSAPRSSPADGLASVLVVRMNQPPSPPHEPPRHPFALRTQMWTTVWTVAGVPDSATLAIEHEGGT